MNKKWPVFVLLLVLVIGISLWLYPRFADWWNSFHQSKAVSNYIEQVSGLDEAQYDQLWDAAWDYNASLLERPNAFVLTEEQKSAYNQLLNVSGNGIMGYIEVPSISVTLPIYHGTSEGVLQVGIGHLEWTSLPVGGESSHCVVSGHRGLPGATLFTNLDELEEGEVFLLYILDEVLTYEVDQIRIVNPNDTQELLIEKGMDYCTLVTCTPYGVNSHRLLVRGHRIETAQEAKTHRVVADAVQIEPVAAAPAVMTPMLLVLLIGWMLPKRKKKQERIL